MKPNDFARDELAKAHRKSFKAPRE